MQERKQDRRGKDWGMEVGREEKELEGKEKRRNEKRETEKRRNEKIETEKKREG
jgi:hypothetical protein